MNYVFLNGNIGKEPRTKTFDNGGSKTRLSLATSRSYKDKSGEWQQETQWHSVDGYGYISKTMQKLQKGDSATIFGRLVYESYETNEGQKKTVAIVNATKVVIHKKGNYVEPSTIGTGSAETDFGMPVENAPANPSPESDFE